MRGFGRQPTGHDRNPFRRDFFRRMPVREASPGDEHVAQRSRAVANGPQRRVGFDAGTVQRRQHVGRRSRRERIFLPGREPFQLEPRDPVLYFLQRLRDEAHRFAIGTHRAKRGRAFTRSVLDEVPGIGARRKKALLHHFGAADAVARAGRAELERVPGISRASAHKIYDWFLPVG